MKNLLIGCTATTLLLVAGSAMAQSNDTALKAKIEAQGYSNVRIVERERDHVDFTAMKGGKKVRLAADVSSGQVHPDNDKDDDDGPKKP
jgi:hypothetical protein